MSAQQPKEFDLDLNDGHWLRYAQNDEDGKYGAEIIHRKPGGTLCVGFISFDVPALRNVPLRVKWTVEKWEPLSLSPSLLCGCKQDHGFIREGKWVRA